MNQDDFARLRLGLTEAEESLRIAESTGSDEAQWKAFAAAGKTLAALGHITLAIAQRMTAMEQKLREVEYKANNPTVGP